MRRKAPDFLLMVSVMGLLAIGIVMVYSSSAVLAEYQQGDSFYYVKRQLLFAVLGLVSMYTLMNIDYWVWRRWAGWLLLGCFLLLVIVLIPGVGLVRGGARSWLGVGAFSIQPAEFVKLAIILYLAHMMANHPERIPSFWRGMVPALFLSGSAFALIMMQPDLGTGTVLMATTVVMLFAAGSRMLHLGGLAILGIVAFAALIAAAPYRMQRIIAFLDPWQDPQGAGYQLIQSLYAIGPGGLMGLGLGKSIQKFGYLPEPQTDFIFSILAEELGFLGAGFVLVLFAVMAWRGVRVAMYAPDFYGSLVAIGIIAMIMIQVVINIGVVTGLLPVTGITLPFLSYGGSSLTIVLTAVGLLLNISRHAQPFPVRL
ncbi:MAG: stage V sporulation protein E [Bacillaceae bacterium G1]|nr:stage V sporulation protein E [Bacillota bacterium]OJF17478.1 MAG: stage V sporulation protein E [Bacillaceae bacterium G1]